MPSTGGINSIEDFIRRIYEINEILVCLNHPRLTNRALRIIYNVALDEYFIKVDQF